MYYLSHFCCICMSTSDLKLIFDVDIDGVSHYNKLTSFVAEMKIKEMNKQRLICEECCVTLNTVYNFQQRCLRSRTNLVNYIAQLQTFGRVSGTLSVCLEDISDAKVLHEEIQIKTENEHKFEEDNSQSDFVTLRYEESTYSPSPVKTECKSEEEAGPTYGEPAGDHLYEVAHTEVVTVKAEPLEPQGLLKDEYMVEYNETDIGTDPLADEREEYMLVIQIPQHGSTYQIITSEASGSGTSRIGKLKRSTTEGSECHDCEICKKSFSDLMALTKHMRIHPVKPTTYEGELYEIPPTLREDEDSDIETEPNVKGYECEKCKKLFMYKYHLDLHSQVHSNEKFTCVECQRVFFHKGDFTVHMRIHTGERPHECSECHKRFRKKSHLTTHMRLHFPDQRFKCEICGKSYNQLVNLKAHIRNHTGESLHTCKVCNKKFNNTGNFKTHMLIHSGERPHECEICKKCFTQKSTLSKHLFMHSDQKPHKCEICQKGFIQLRILKKHRLTHEKQEGV